MSNQVPAISRLVAGSTVKSIIPTDFEQVVRIARTAVHAGMFKSNKGEDAALAQATMAVLQGLELGIPPMQAVQQIAVINGKCTIYGSLVPAMIWKAGHKIKEWIEGEGDSRVAYCEITRGDNKEVIKRKFSVKDAIRAGLWNQSPTIKKQDWNTKKWEDKPNDSPWYKHEERMLQMRARGFCARDGVPDVLCGLYIREEMDEEERFENAKDITPAAEFLPPPAPEEEAQASPETETQEAPTVEDEFLSGLDVSLSSCACEDQLHEVWAENLEAICAFGQERRMKAEAVFERHQSRITGQASLLGEM